MGSILNKSQKSVTPIRLQYHLLPRVELISEGIGNHTSSLFTFLKSHSTEWQSTLSQLLAGSETPFSLLLQNNYSSHHHYTSKMVRRMAMVMDGDAWSNCQTRP